MANDTPPNDAAHIMRLRAAEGPANAIADLVAETFDPEEAVAVIFEQGEGWAVEIYFAAQPDEDMVRELVRVVAPDVADRAEFSANPPRSSV